MKCLEEKRKYKCMDGNTDRGPKAKNCVLDILVIKKDSAFPEFVLLREIAGGVMLNRNPSRRIDSHRSEFKGLFCDHLIMACDLIYPTGRERIFFCKNILVTLFRIVSCRTVHHSILN